MGRKFKVAKGAREKDLAEGTLAFEREEAEKARIEREQKERKLKKRQDVNGSKQIKENNDPTSDESHVVVREILDDVLNAGVKLMGQEKSDKAKFKFVEAFEFDPATTSESLDSELDMDIDLHEGFTVHKTRKRHRRDMQDSSNKVHIRSSSLDKEEFRKNLQHKAKVFQSVVNKDLSM